MIDVLEHEKLVYRVANRYRSMGERIGSVDDLVQIGWLGLLKAARDFRPDYGFAFSSYAYQKIDGEIRRYLRQASAGLHFSKTVYAMYTRIQVEGWHSVSNAYIAEQTGQSEAMIDAARNLYATPYTLSTVLPDSEYSIEDQLGRTQDFTWVEVVDAFSRTLSPPLQQTLQLHLNGNNQNEIAQMLGVSQVTISRRLKKIRAALQSFLGIEAQNTRPQRMGSRWETKKKVGLLG